MSNFEPEIAKPGFFYRKNAIRRGAAFERYQYRQRRHAPERAHELSLAQPGHGPKSPIQAGLNPPQKVGIDQGRPLKSSSQFTPSAGQEGALNRRTTPTSRTRLLNRQEASYLPQTPLAPERALRQALGNVGQFGTLQRERPLGARRR